MGTVDLVAGGGLHRRTGTRARGWRGSTPRSPAAVRRTACGAERGRSTGDTRASSEDFVLRRPTRFGLGFQLTMPERPLGPSPRAFGHFGAGGSLGFADPDARVAFGYAMNQGRAGRAATLASGL
jgi:CubicO group peptidase (beta-lactamase class C family)